MRKSVFLPGLVFLVVIGSIEFGCNQKEKKISLNIMTYNVRFAADQPDTYSWKNRKDGILKSFEDTDIAALQEVMPVQVADINSAISGYDIIYRSRETDSMAGEGVPLIFKEERFLLVNSGTFWLSDTPEVPGFPEKK
jgi:endonuclease/exonuclease/phosphatase family metal-dependent hydrolase